MEFIFLLILDRIVNFQATLSNEDEEPTNIPSIVIQSASVPLLSPLARDTFHLTPSCLYDLFKDSHRGTCIFYTAIFLFE